VFPVPGVLGAVVLLSVSPSVRQSVQAQTTTVEVRPGRATVIAGSRLQLSAVPRDAGGKEVTGKNVTWFAAPFDVAAIDEKGNLLGLRQGRAQVFAIADGKTGIAVIEIEPKDVATIELVPTQPEIPVGGATVLNARRPHRRQGTALQRGVHLSHQ
jgi:hypothetical protein